MVQFASVNRAGEYAVIQAVAIYCLLASGACLASFFIIAYYDSKKAAVASIEAKSRAQPSDSADSLARLTEATGKLVEALTKAGPSLSALAAAILFAMISAYIAKPAPADAPKTTDVSPPRGGTATDKTTH